MQLQVMNSPFNQEQVELLNQSLSTLTPSQKVWLSGYLAAQQSLLDAGSLDSQGGKLPNVSAGQTISKEVTILFGSQTGNAQSLAENAGKTLSGRGYQVTVSSMSDFKPNNLKKVKNLLIVVSTHGEGDPPDNAMTFYEYLTSKRAPKLDDLRFSVLSLGDSSYEFFCQTGKDFEKRLADLGGKSLYKRVDCDLDFEEPATEWLEGVTNGLSEGQGESGTQVTTVAPKVVASAYSRTNPFRAEVLENVNLNGRGSNKETRHLELSLEGSGLTFEAGDCLGIYPENDPLEVDLLLNELKWNPDEMVAVNKQGDMHSLKEALTSHFEITGLTKALFKQVAQLSTNEDVKELISTGNEAKLKAYLQGRDVLDLIRDYGIWGESAQDFVSTLRKMPPRLYSIASSLNANPEEVHLTIGAVRYEAHGRERKGVCSILCAERLQPGDTLPVFIQQNKNFKLPENTDTPIIMVGPGTGIAPFRSFLQEHEESGAEGKTWLFFGDQHFMTDFLYQTEWQKFIKAGALTKMDVAFSRDAEEKVYVQHRMLEQSKELFSWLQEGAAVYVCGDKNSMAKDVQNTLLQIIENEGGMSSEKAEEYLADMKKQKRYQRDVY